MVEDIERTEGIHYLKLQGGEQPDHRTEKAVAKQRKSRKQPEETYMGGRYG